jgi:rRNA-processing protein FCF1
MYIPKFYLETTMFNFYFEGKGKEKQLYTRQLFDAIAAGKYEPFTSAYVIRELERAANRNNKPT